MMKTFREFMLAAMGRTEEQFQADMVTYDRDYTYLFESVGPDNRIVTKYEKNELVFLSCVHNETGQESLVGANPHTDDDKSQLVFPEWNVRQVLQYAFDTAEECLTTLSALKNLEEGYVVYTPMTGERIKIKSPVYVAAHRLRGNGLTINSVCELVAMGETSEYLNTFPEDLPKFEPAMQMLAMMQEELVDNYNQYKDIADQKEFALKVKDLPLSSIMFLARRKNEQVIHTLNCMGTNKKAGWLKERLCAQQ